MPTTVHLHDLCDPAELVDALAARHVRVQTHPTEPLAILNYTETCVVANGWNTTTLRCRGLIYRTDTLQVVARGFDKFFNHGQPGAPTIALDAPVLALDKMDGSLGVVYPLPSGGWAVATRGSFTSEQALHATALLNTRYPHYRPRPGTTPLVEIIYPANRIVLDYAGLNDLVLLGGVDIAGGAVFDPTWFGDWPGPAAQPMPAATFADALALPPRRNAEGMVVRCLHTGGMVKLKQADYVALHKLVTGLTARVVWQHLVDGRPVDDILAPLPDEFHSWVRDVAADITTRVDQHHTELTKAYAQLRADLGDTTDRKTFALAAAAHPDRWAMFALLDGRDIRPELLKRARPEPYLTPHGATHSEDNA